jgi:hypothetical protein
MPTFQSFGSGFAQAAQPGLEILAQYRRDTEKAKAESAGARIYADYAHRQGIIDDETYAKFYKSSPQQQVGMLGSFIAIDAHNRQQSEQLDRDRRTALAFREYNRRLTESQFTPPSVVAPVTTATGEPLAYPLQTSPGQFTYRQPPDKLTPPTEQQQSEANAMGGRIIWTGDKYQFQQWPQGTGKPTKDPETGLWMQDGKVLPYNEQKDIEDLLAERAKAQQPKPTPAPGMATKVYQAIFGGGTPTPTPAPSATPAAAPIRVAPGAGRALTPQDQEALAWARNNPDDPRADAILAKLGITQ